MTYVRSADALIVVDYINGAKVKVPKKQRKNYAPRNVTQRWQLSPGVGVEGNADGQLTMVSGEQKVDIVQAGVGIWDIAQAREGSSIAWHTTDWGVKAPGAVLSRSVTLPRKGGQEVMITVFVPRGSADSVPVTIGDSMVTITRNGTPITVGFPAPN